MNLIRCTRCGSHKPQRHFKKVSFITPSLSRWYGNPLPSPQRVGEGLCFTCSIK
jgi:hypothetical protein